MLDLPEQTQVRRQVERSDHHSVEPFHPGDLGGVLDAGRVLDHRQHRHLRVRIAQVLPQIGAVARCVSHANATRPVGRVASGAHRSGGSRGVADRRYLDAVDPEIQRLLDVGRVVGEHAYDARGRCRCEGVNAGPHGAERERSVLGVDHDVIESAPPEDGRHSRVGDGENGAEYRPGAAQQLAQSHERSRVLRVHGAVLLARRRSRPMIAPPRARQSRPTARSSEFWGRRSPFWGGCVRLVTMSACWDDAARPCLSCVQGRAPDASRQATGEPDPSER